jgi:RNA 2',3'-cyclic 3'-phosphodiesterase
MPRLFIAVDIPEEVAFELERLCTGLPAVRWVDPDDFHLTVRFIGEVDHATFYDIGEVLTSISMRPFDLTLKGLGTFPPRGAPHTLWTGVDDQEKLLSLKRRIDRVVDEVGIERERRKFAPHVTLARFREPPAQDRFGSWVARRSLFRTQPFPVSSFSLYSSVLRPEGAQHYLEASYDFVTGVMERV